MSEEKVYEGALLRIVNNVARGCSCCTLNLAIAESALGTSNAPTLTPAELAYVDRYLPLEERGARLALHGDRTYQERRDAQGSGEAGELAHYPV